MEATNGSENRTNRAEARTVSGDVAADELTVPDGRKVIGFAASGESYSIETTEQSARGKSAELEAEMQEIKLRAMRRGIRHIRL